MRGELIEDRGGGRRHERLEEYRADSYRLEKIVENGSETRHSLLALREHPRSRLVNILVRAAEEREDRVARVRDVEGVHIVADSPACVGAGGFQLGVELFVLVGRSDRRLDHAAEILVSHRDSAVDEVSEIVREVGVVAGYHFLIRDASVGGIRHLGEAVVSHAVDSEALYEVVRVDDVSS